MQFRRLFPALPACVTAKTQKEAWQNPAEPDFPRFLHCQESTASEI